MTKALTYEQLLLLGPDAIRELYPFGAKEWKKRWIPVLEGEEPDRPLKRLLKDKKDTIEKPLYVKRSYSRSNYTHISSEALGVDKHGKGAPEEAIVTSADQARFAKEAKERFNTTHAEEQHRAVLRSYLARVRTIAIEQVKAGVDVETAFRDAVTRVIEDDQRKAA